MEPNKPSTADILAKIRAQKAAGAPAASNAAPPAAPATPEPAVPAAAAPAPVKPAQPATPAAKPGSTKDILAAIRAGKGGAAPAAPTEAPAAVTAPSPAPIAKPAPAATSGSPLPSVQDMLKAVREGKPAVAEAAKVKAPVVAPPMPAKPVIPAKKSAAPSPARRSLSGLVVVAAISLACFTIGALTGNVLIGFFGVLVWGAAMTPFAAAWASITAVTGISVLGVARFMFPNVLTEPPSKFKVGPASDYPLNTVSNKWKDQFGVWIVHTDQYEGKNLLYALTSVCTHLGCTPNWLEGEQKFKCPCHGSGFYITGINFEGPAPRPLERAGIRIAEDGMLEVDKSVKFQEEMGQWKDATSFVQA